MKKVITLSSIVLSSFVFVGTVFAGIPGFYAGGGLGVSRLDMKDKSLFNDRGWNDVQTSVKRGGLGWRLFGGYNFNEYLGVELGYTAFAHSKYSTFHGYYENRLVTSRKNSLKALSIVAKGSLPIGSTGFSLYALGGGAQVYNRIERFGFDESESDNKFRPTYGAGIEYAFSEQLTTNLELSRISGENKRWSSIPNADSLTLNIAYHFN